MGSSDDPNQGPGDVSQQRGDPTGALVAATRDHGPEGVTDEEWDAFIESLATTPTLTDAASVDVSRP